MIKFIGKNSYRNCNQSHDEIRTLCCEPLLRELVKKKGMQNNNYHEGPG